MSNDIAIRVENLGKRYQLGQSVDLSRTFRETLISLPRFFAQKAGSLAHSLSRSLVKPDGEMADEDTPQGTFWALKDVCFEVKRGEVVGIIGRNGAGKSTLLKILSRITTPTTGRAEIHGRVGSLLEVGTGFHPELTGRENIYLNGAILGMRKVEIERKFDEIVAFAEIEKFLDTPVKRYSSGMYVRLAFAVAAHLEPEILIVDEVLAVGDAEFQKKCLGKMEDVSGQGRTVLFVSHNMAAIQALCLKGILLKDGTVVCNGSVHGVIDTYLSSFDKSVDNISLRSDREGDGSARGLDIWIEDIQGRKIYAIPCGEDLFFCVHYEIKNPSNNYYFALGIYDKHKCPIAHLSTRFVPLSDSSLPRKGVLRCRVPRVPLPTGHYFLNLSITKEFGGRADRIQHACDFYIETGCFYSTAQIPPAENGKVLLDYAWEVNTTY